MKYIECPDCNGQGVIFRYEKCVCDNGLTPDENGDLETCTCCDKNNEIEYVDPCHKCNCVGRIWEE